MMSSHFLGCAVTPPFAQYHAMRLLRLLVLTAVSVGVAEVSWFLIERPLLQLKDRVPLLNREKRVATSTVVGRRRGPDTGLAKMVREEAVASSAERVAAKTEQASAG